MKKHSITKLFCPFIVWIHCSSDLKNFANSQPSASNFKSFSRSLEHFFLTVGHDNFGNKIPIFLRNYWQNFIHIISYQKDPNWRDYLVSTHDYNLKLYRGEWIVLVVSGHALFLSPLLWCHPEIYMYSAPNNSNETHTFMCLGRADRFWQQ